MTIESTLADQPACPACRSLETHLEQGDRHQCDRCLYRFRVSATGTVTDFVPWTTAGRNIKKFVPRRWGR